MNTILFIKTFFTTFASILFIDYLWIGIFMHKFYDTELGTLAKRANGALSAHIPSVIIVYILLAIGITFFVIPNSNSLLKIALIGALFGLIIYGVYDFTNYSILDKYGLKLVVVDIIWGTFLCGTVSVLIKAISSKFF